MPLRLAHLPRVFCALFLVIWAIVPASPSAQAHFPLAAFTCSVTASRVDIFDAESAFRGGDYEQAIELAARAIEEKAFVSERWYNVKMKSELALGQYNQALDSLKGALERFGTEIEVRRIGIEVLQFNEKSADALKLRDEIEELYRRNSWRYRDADELVTMGRVRLAAGSDAKQVLTEFYDRAIIDLPSSPIAYLAIGDLALEKHDYRLAIKNFRLAIEKSASDPAAYLGLAKALRETDAKAAGKAIEKALELNPRHVPSLNYQIDFLVNAEEYDRARQKIEKILAINPSDPVAWSFQAVLAHLANRPEEESNARSEALKFWKQNPHVDHLIGKKLSQKYRFKESARYQRRALMLDEDYLPAKIQLAHDLLRTGQELEGWRLADQVFDEDQYSVVAHNLVTLRNQLANFETIEHDGFIVRMSKREANIYGAYVCELLSEAKRELVSKYQVELETPIFIEIFPEQQDFAIRTFGLPGGQGFLGVCFGRLITMNSPAAQGPRLTNWQSVLWHEFCHVVTLQKTKNKMPRWLSEGISVYEERLKNPAWGQAMNPRYREWMLKDDLLPISELSSAFLRANTPEAVDFAYFESSLAVEFLVSEYGMDRLRALLEQLAIGLPINDAIRRTMAPLNVIDQQFRGFVDEQVKAFSPTADWSENSVKSRELELATLKSLLDSGKYDAAILAADRLAETYEGRETQALCRLTKANCYRELKEPAKELDALLSVLKVDADNVDVGLRGIALARQRNDHENMKVFAKALVSVNPILRRPHETLAEIASLEKDDAGIVNSLLAILELEPVDLAETHFQLASAYYRQENWESARRHVLLSLVQAPRYAKAHRLLLEVRAATDAAAEKANNLAVLPTVNEEDEENHEK